MSRDARRYALPAALAVLLHGLVTGGLVAGARLFGWADQLVLAPGEIEVEVTADEIAPPAVAPEPEPAAAAPAERPSEVVAPRAPSAHAVVAAHAAARPEPVEPIAATPAPGSAGGEPFDLGETGPAGTIPGLAQPATAAGTGTGTGTGAGTGSGTGSAAGAGAGDDTGSIAALKTLPEPIGDTDFVEAHRDYPAEATQLGIEGEVKVRLVVDVAGKVVARKLVGRGLGHGLDQLALRLAARLRFRPATDDGDHPVKAALVWTFHFTLPR